MKRNKIPGTGIEVSPICLGTMTFGTPVAESEAVKIVHWAMDNGINFIDTADIYEGYKRFLGSPGGVGESILGTALQGRRDKAVVTSKVGNQIGGAGYEGTGLGRKHILHQVNASLARLRTDYFDFYELHKADPETPLEESVGTMADLVKEGKIRHWGFSNFEAAQVEQLLNVCKTGNLPAPVVAQPLYNWLERGSEKGYLQVCRANNIAITPYQPLQGGLLTGKYQADQPPPPGSRGVEHPKWLKMDEGVHEKLKTFVDESKRSGLKPAQYAIRWLLLQPGVTSVVAGVKSIGQLEDLMGGVL